MAIRSVARRLVHPDLLRAARRAAAARRSASAFSAFRIAGGIMLFMIALDMVFEKRTERREKRAEEIEGTPEAEDISVFPMAIPMIAGPGSIASIMLLIGARDGLDRMADRARRADRGHPADPARAARSPGR